MQEKNPYFLALDLELNQPSEKIIQVGIAIGHAEQREEDYCVRSWLISPEEPISDMIVALTGIDDAAIAREAVPWTQMAEELSALIKQFKPFVNPLTWGGGDDTELKAGLAARGIPFRHFGRRRIDIKTWHVMNSFANGKRPGGGLQTVMKHYGLAFHGKAHRADVDAFNTLRLFFWMLRHQAARATIADASAQES